MTETPGATRSGFVKRFGIEAAPRPEKSAGVFVFASQAPTVITELAEDGTVSVLYGSGERKRVAPFKLEAAGSHISNVPFFIEIGSMIRLHTPEVK